MMEQNQKPIIFGEVLFDHFPDQARLGGAPFNVAWHLQGFGLEPHFISRVGADVAGDEILSKMKAWGMDTSGVQRDPTYATGAVDITMEGSHHMFAIKPNQAYDQIDTAEATERVPQDPLLLYHGSLALRDTVSRTTLSNLRQQLSPPVFVDVNVRHPWWSDEIAAITLHNATWTKLSENELDLLFPGESSRLERAQRLHQELGSEVIFLTKGQDGAALVSPESTYEHTPTTHVKVADTVGAGDAFSSVAIFGIANNWQYDATLLRAMQFAEAVCGIQGALFDDKRVYEQFLEQWTQNNKSPFGLISVC